MRLPSAQEALEHLEIMLRGIVINNTDFFRRVLLFNTLFSMIIINTFVCLVGRDNYNLHTTL